MNRKNTTLNIILPIVIGLAIVAGIFIGIRIDTSDKNSRFLIYPKSDKLTNIINYIEQEYVDTVDREDLIEDAVPSLLENLDPHSVYIPASDLQRVNEPLEGGFSGIGVQFNMQKDTIAIIKTIPNGPSELVGILPGDRIIFVEDSLVAGVDMPTNDVIGMLKGKKGTKVMVKILRRGEPELIDFEIVRDDIPLYSVDVSYMITDKIGYIKINQFSRTTHAEFLKGMQKLRAMGMEKIIVDLRGNGGGYLNAATKIADEFLAQDLLIVYTEGRARPRNNEFATDEGLWEDKDVLILIDEYSASASEILAGAIQDNDRGVIMGRRSFGKGLVQEQIVLNDGSAMRLTIARYYTPTGRSIQKPYTNGKKDYYMEVMERYEHGEFVDSDSIKFADSLKYKTPEGNIVYGGGGIMPDIFIPIDTTGYTEYFGQLRNRGLIYRFAFEYTDKNRAWLSELETVDQILRALERKNMMKEFIRFADKNGIKPGQKDLAVSGDIIETQLKAYIARNIIDNDGFYPIIHKIDQTLQSAVELFSTLETRGNQLTHSLEKK